RQYLDSGEIARAESRLAQARVRMQSATGGTLEQTVLQNSAIVREKAQAEFDNAVSQAESSLAAGDTDKATAFASSGQLSLDRAKSFFSQAEADSMNSRLRDLQRRIEARRDELAVTRRKDAETAAAAEATKAKERLRNDRERKVSEGIERVRALQREQKYDEALEVTNQVLFIDPNNPSALLLRDIIGDIIIMKQAQTQGRRMQSNMRTFRMQGQEAMIPPTELVEYPTDWPRLTQMRTGAGGYYESPANRSAMATLQGKIVPVQFNRVPLENALAYLAKNTGVDIDADWASLKQLGVGPETPITIDRINDQPAKVVLEDIIGRITRDNFARADYAIRDGVVRIGSADVIRQQTVVEHYPITDLLQVAPDYADVPETDLYKITRNRQMRGAGLAGTADPFQRKAEAGKPGASDRREKIRQVVGVIQNTVDANSWRDNGGDVGSIMELNGVLVITTSPRNHREITGLLSRLREIRQTQINVETRFLLVNQDFFEQISFDLDLYFNTNSNQITEARALDPNIRPSDFFAFPGNQFLRRTLDGGAYASSADNTTPTTLPFVRGGGGAAPGAGSGASQQQVQPTVLPANWSPIGAGNGSAALTRTLTPTNNNFVSNLLAANPALGIAGQYLDDIQVDFVIRATQADRRTITLNAPRLTFTNGQIANVVVGSQRGYISDLEVVTGDGSVGFDPDPDTVSDGVTLLIEGVTSADRRYVTLNVEAGVSTVQELANFPTTAATDGVLVTGNVQLPLLSVSRVNTTVTVPDQGTILLGGQRLTSELEIESPPSWCRASRKRSYSPASTTPSAAGTESAAQPDRRTSATGSPS
ncbi:MAG: hypothetical protein MUE97_08240, partial [Phycisphaerales bacterium]|nr:hypothetical protein [Phycisphaerales bacterium]